MYFIYVILLIIAVIIVLINFQPYKTSVSHYTVIDASFLILLSLFFRAIYGNKTPFFRNQYYLNIFYGLATVTCIIPIIYVIFIMLHSMYSSWIFGKSNVEEDPQHSAYYYETFNLRLMRGQKNLIKEYNAIIL